MLSNPPSNRVSLIYHYFLYEKGILVKKIEGKIYQIHYKFHPLKILVHHAPESPDKHMTTIYHYFCIKNKYFFYFFM